ncbi:hypothetical protein SERLA73DRAFT_139614, partial [Serpula lacrymans var. lacrymans S7.3]
MNHGTRLKGGEPSQYLICLSTSPTMPDTILHVIIRAYVVDDSTHEKLRKCTFEHLKAIYEMARELSISMKRDILSVRMSVVVCSDVMHSGSYN